MKGHDATSTKGLIQMETNLLSIASPSGHPSANSGAMGSNKASAMSTRKNNKFHELDDDQRKLFRRLKRTIEAFRSLYPNMPTSYVDAFLSVVLEPGKGPSDYAEDMGTIQPIASRVLLEIGTKARLRDEGLHLVDRQLSDTSLRNHELFLTPKGRQLMKQIEKIWEDA